MNRKDFFKECFISGFKLFKDHPLVEKLAQMGGRKERPPGAQVDDRLFKEMCTGCDACMIACPVNVIMIEDLEKRHPVIFPEKAPCIHCEGTPCISVCPTGALKHDYSGFIQGK